MEEGVKTIRAEPKERWNVNIYANSLKQFQNSVFSFNQLGPHITSSPYNIFAQPPSIWQKQVCSLGGKGETVEGRGVIRGSA